MIIDRAGNVLSSSVLKESDNNPAIFVGRWDDVDPNNPGPSGYSFNFRSDRTFHIQVSASAYDGHWSYSSADSSLVLTIEQSFNESGQTDFTANLEYRVTKITDDRFVIKSQSDQERNFSGTYWKLPTQPEQ